DEQYYHPGACDTMAAPSDNLHLHLRAVLSNTPRLLRKRVEPHCADFEKNALQNQFDFRSDGFCRLILSSYAHTTAPILLCGTPVEHHDSTEAVPVKRV
ncbi:hypothetical protein GCK32_019938, partial [Trichostrongylus colubriformis]